MVMGIVGNVMVVLWRRTRPRQQRGSVLSLMIIILAAADFLYCVHLAILLIMSSVERYKGVTYSTLQMDIACFVSGNLSLLSCSAAMWMTLNIAIYSRQVLTGRNCCCNCCSLVGRKRCLFITVFCQLIFTVMPIIAFTIYTNVFFGVLEDPFLVDFFTQCSYAQACQPETCVLNASEGIFQCMGLDETAIASAGILASINIVLCASCAFLYLSICMYLRRQGFRRDDHSAVHSSSVEELITLYWRLTLIVFINVVTWLPVTVAHWYTIGVASQQFSFNSSVNYGSPVFKDLTATNLILVSVGPAVNPLIYTIAGRQFIQSVKRCRRQLRCRVSFHCSQETSNEDYRIGVRQCSCIPCIHCIRPWEYLDSVQWDTEETSAFLSDDDQSDS